MAEEEERRSINGWQHKQHVSVGRPKPVGVKPMGSTRQRIQAVREQCTLFFFPNSLLDPHE